MPKRRSLFKMCFKNILAFNFSINSFSKSLLYVGSISAAFSSPRARAPFFFTPSTTDTHNTCAERGRVRSG